MITGINANHKMNLISGQNDRMAGSMPVYGQDKFADKLAEVEPAAGDDKDKGNNSASFGFSDFFDIINPLQHIPIVSAIYRQITGDEISTVAEVTGGGLYGGPVGAAIAAATSVVKIAIKSSKEESESESSIMTAKVIKPVVNHDNDTTIVLANLRKGYTSFNA